MHVQRPALRLAQDRDRVPPLPSPHSLENTSRNASSHLPSIRSRDHAPARSRACSTFPIAFRGRLLPEMHPPRRLEPRQLRPCTCAITSASLNTPPQAAAPHAPPGSPASACIRPPPSPPPPAICRVLMQHPLDLRRVDVLPARRRSGSRTPVMDCPAPIRRLPRPDIARMHTTPRPSAAAVASGSLPQYPVNSCGPWTSDLSRHAHPAPPAPPLSTARTRTARAPAAPCWSPHRRSPTRV